VKLLGSRFAAEVEASRALMGRAQALLIEARQYKRDRKGQFSSTGGGGGDDDDDETAAPNVVATKRISAQDGDEMDLSVIREDDGTTRLHIGLGAEGSTEGLSTSLDRAGVDGLREGLVSSTAAARTRQSEVKDLQSEADKLDARIDEITQKTMGAPTEHGREYVPLSESDAAERETLTRKWEKLDERIGELEDDGEDVSTGTIRGRDGDVRYTSTVRIPARDTYVRVAVGDGGGVTFNLRAADRLAETLGEMASQM
jgi:hypothetical protein